MLRAPKKLSQWAIWSVFNDTNISGRSCIPAHKEVCLLQVYPSSLEFRKFSCTSIPSFWCEMSMAHQVDVRIQPQANSSLLFICIILLHELLWFCEHSQFIYLSIPWQAISWTFNLAYLSHHMWRPGLRLDSCTFCNAFRDLMQRMLIAPACISFFTFCHSE